MTKKEYAHKVIQSLRKKGLLNEGLLKATIKESDSPRQKPKLKINSRRYYRVKLLPNNSASPDQVVRGYLGKNGEIEEFPWGVATKEAEKYGGKIEDCTYSALFSKQLKNDEDDDYFDNYDDD